MADDGSPDTGSKIKVGDEDDLERIRLIHSVLGSDIRLFADANGAWNRAAAARRIEELTARNVWALEGPPCMQRSGSAPPRMPNSAWTSTTPPTTNWRSACSHDRKFRRADLPSPAPVVPVTVDLLDHRLRELGCLDPLAGCGCVAAHPLADGPADRGVA